MGTATDDVVVVEDIEDVVGANRPVDNSDPELSENRKPVFAELPASELETDEVTRADTPPDTYCGMKHSQNKAIHIESLKPPIEQHKEEGKRDDETVKLPETLQTYERVQSIRSSIQKLLFLQQKQKASGTRKPGIAAHNKIRRHS